MKLLVKKDVKHAFYIGGISFVVYMMCYFGRNILSVVAPQIVKETTISEVFIGTLATANMICYACGQLINGIIGDKVKGKYLVSGGLVLSGICNFIMAFTGDKISMIVAYSAIGFFFSMLYAPLVKMIAENTQPSHAMRCCLGLSFASLIGAPIAGTAAMFFEWNLVFALCGGFLILVGILFFLGVLAFEKKGIVKYRTVEKADKQSGSIKVLLERSIVKFTFVSILSGVVRTSVLFWVPTYLSRYLHFSVEEAAMAFSVLSCLKATGPYLNSLFLYERVLKKDINKMLLVSFAISTISFVMMFTVHHAIINMIFLVLALLSADGASEVMFAAYCPSLHDTGMVSTATGYLDAVSYGAAAVANLLFANAISAIGWGNLILVWSAIMGFGVIISIPWKKRLNS